MADILYWNGKMSDLLKLHGDEKYSDIWTYNQAWASGERQWNIGNWEEAAKFLGRLRQELYQLHLNLYPEDPLWLRKEELYEPHSLFLR